MYAEAAQEENNDARNELLKWAKASEKTLRIPQLNRQGGSDVADQPG